MPNIHVSSLFKGTMSLSCTEPPINLIKPELEMYDVLLYIYFAFNLKLGKISCFHFCHVLKNTAYYQKLFVHVHYLKRLS